MRQIGMLSPHRSLQVDLLAGREQATGVGSVVQDVDGDVDDDGEEEGSAFSSLWLDLHTVDLSLIDGMYEKATAGPLDGPLLRLFLAQYIRYAHATHTCPVLRCLPPHSMRVVPALAAVLTRPCQSCCGVLGFVLHGRGTCAHLYDPFSWSRTYVRSRHMELLQLRAIQRLNPPFDVAFIVAHRLRHIKKMDKASLTEGGRSCSADGSSRHSHPFSPCGCFFLCIGFIP